MLIVVEADVVVAALALACRPAGGIVPQALAVELEALRIFTLTPFAELDGTSVKSVQPVYTLEQLLLGDGLFYNFLRFPFYFLLSLFVLLIFLFLSQTASVALARLFGEATLVALEKWLLLGNRI